MAKVWHLPRTYQTIAAHGPKFPKSAVDFMTRGSVSGLGKDQSKRNFIPSFWIEQIALLSSTQETMMSFTTLHHHKYSKRNFIPSFWIEQIAFLWSTWESMMRFTTLHHHKWHRPCIHFWGRRGLILFPSRIGHSQPLHSSVKNCLQTQLLHDGVVNLQGKSFTPIPDVERML
jgi:hypothetical protein